MADVRVKRLRVWLYDEWKDYDADEREDCAWVPPDTKSILYPENPGIPVTDVEKAAELYAAYFHSQRDGWESTWPIEFVVHDPIANTYVVIEVERETVPEFHASKPRTLLGPPPTDAQVAP